MRSETVHVLNTQTGQVGDIRRKLFESPVFNYKGMLVEADGDQKPYVPALFKAKPLDVDDSVEAVDEPGDSEKE